MCSHSSFGPIVLPSFEFGFNGVASPPVLRLWLAAHGPLLPDAVHAVLRLQQSGWRPEDLGEEHAARRGEREREEVAGLDLVQSLAHRRLAVGFGGGDSRAGEAGQATGGGGGARPRRGRTR